MAVEGLLLTSKRGMGSLGMSRNGAGRSRVRRSSTQRVWQGCKSGKNAAVNLDIQAAPVVVLIELLKMGCGEVDMIVKNHFHQSGGPDLE